MKIKEIALAVLALSTLGAGSSVSLYYMSLWRQHHKNNRYYYRCFEEVAVEFIDTKNTDTFNSRRNYLIKKMTESGYTYAEANIIARDAENDVGDALGYPFALKKIK